MLIYQANQMARWYLAVCVKPSSLFHQCYGKTRFSGLKKDNNTAAFILSHSNKAKSVYSTSLFFSSTNLSNDHSLSHTISMYLPWLLKRAALQACQHESSPSFSMPTPTNSFCTFSSTLQAFLLTAFPPTAG